jgi:hypothetical protein
MSIQRLDPGEVAVRAVDNLGLAQAAVDLFSPEGLCASLRRAASFLCPASPRQIIDAVHDALTPLRNDLERDDLVEAVDVLVGVGDLLELRQAGPRTRLLFLGPPSYVEKQPGEFLLLGVRPNAGALVDEETLGAEVIYEAHTRTVVLDPESAAEALGAAGLHRLSREQWIRSPRREAAAAVIEQAQERLVAARAPGQVSGLKIIDSTAPVHYYKGRWREPTIADDGIFVGRRPQAYGAPIWCVIQLARGVPQAVLDLPVDSSVAPGSDEARRLQAALDAHRGGPQVYRVRASRRADGASFLDFFGPLPSWAERYMDLIGMPLPKAQGALFSYRVPEAVVEDTRVFLSTSSWMTATEGEQRL